MYEMTDTFMKMVDFNENFVDLDLDLESDFLDGEKMAASSVPPVKSHGGDSMNELDDLLNNPSKFLKSGNSDVSLELFNVDDEHDMDLMKYFIGSEEPVAEPKDKDKVQDQSLLFKENNVEVDLEQKDAKTALNDAIINARSENARKDKTNFPSFVHTASRTRQVSHPLPKNAGVVKVVKIVSPLCRSSTDDDADDNDWKTDSDYRPTMKAAMKAEQPMSTSKAAVQAKENRAKKKMYIDNLEKTVSMLNEENDVLKKDTSKMSKMIKKLQTEVEYLSSVLANQSTLSALLKNVCSTPGIKFSSGQTQQDSDDDEEVDVVSLKPTVVRNNQNRKRSLESSDEEDERKENRRGSEVKMTTRNQKTSNKVSRLDHDYATDVKSCQVVLSKKSVLPSAMQSHQKKPAKSLHSKKPSTAGVCLHVSDNVVSLEFCAKCSNKATGKGR